MSRFENLEFGGREEERAASPRAGVRNEAFYLEEAQGAFESGRFEEALRFYSKALEFNPKNAASWTGQVRMLIELGEFGEARLWADKALAMFPDDGELLAAKAVALARLGDLAGAISFSDAAVESLANTPYIWLSRADVLLARNEKKAEFCFQKAFDLAANNWLVLWLASRIMAFYQRFAAALKLARQALELDASRAVLWMQTGKCEFALGLAAQSRHSLDQARELDPGCPVENIISQTEKLTFLDKAAARWRQWFRK